jgi:hypothetical protein
MKKLQEIILIGASFFVYDILQKTIEIVLSNDAIISEIGQTETIDENGNMIVLLKMIYRK